MAAAAAGAASSPTSPSLLSHWRARSSQSWPMGGEIQQVWGGAGLLRSRPPPPWPPFTLPLPEMRPLNVRGQLSVGRRLVRWTTAGMQYLCWSVAGMSLRGGVDQMLVCTGKTPVDTHSDRVRSAKWLNITYSWNSPGKIDHHYIIRRKLMTIHIATCSYILMRR